MIFKILFVVSVGAFLGALDAFLLYNCPWSKK